MTAAIPVVLFAYARPVHTARVLAALRANAVPLLEVFADGAKGPVDEAAVAATRAVLRGVDWCELRLTERTANLGLGRNVLAGVDDVAARREMFVVWEDDLLCVPGAYAWLCAALRRYADEPRVMSVAAWTHPRVTPRGVGDSAYCDIRAECWGWATWARAWRGMSAQTAAEKLAEAVAKGVAADAAGWDVPVMAAEEMRRNLWAVRWLAHHLAQGGLCVRPPWSMAEHIGFDDTATNAAGAGRWANAPLRAAPAVPAVWPEAREARCVRALWRRATAGDRRGFWRQWRARLGWD